MVCQLAKQHRLERIFEAMKEDFLHDLELLKQSSVDADGRPMFWKALTDEEQLQRFLNDASRESIEMNTMKEGGVDAVVKYRDKMRKMMNAMLEKPVRGA